ncbi:uncharacterized protein LOC143447433 isoform X2 [Clavelina lepadiformis]
MLNKPIICDLGGLQGKVAIFLMDTQGLFDLHTSEADGTVIAALTLLMSSCVIFNVKSEINSTHLQWVHKFTKFAKELKESGGRKSPFQELLFLIRDWLRSDKYGFNGGRKYLDYLIPSCNYGRAEEHRLVQEDTKATFDNISCSVMRYPGNNVARMSDTSKCRLKDVGENFSSQVEEICEKIFSPQGLVLKMIDGQQTTGRDLYQYVEVHSKTLDEDFLGKVKSFIELEIEIVVQKYQEWFISNFTNSVKGSRPDVTEKDINEKFFRLKEETLKKFDEHSKPNSPDLIMLGKNKLSTSMDEKLKIKKVEIEIVVQKCQEWFISNFTNSVKGSRPDVTEKDINEKFFRLKEETLTKFDEHSKPNSPDLIMLGRNKLSTSMDEKLKIKKVEIEIVVQKCQEWFISNFTNSVKGSRPDVTEKDINEKFFRLKEETLTKFDEHSKPNSPDLIMLGRNKLSTSMHEKLKIKKVEIEIVVQKCQEWFISNFTNSVKGSRPDVTEKDINEKFFRLKEETLKKFDEQSKPNSPDLIMLGRNKLSTFMDEKLKIKKVEIEIVVQKCQEWFISNFTNSVKGSRPDVTEKDINEKFFRLKEETLKKFDEQSKSNSPDLIMLGRNKLSTSMDEKLKIEKVKVKHAQQKYSELIERYKEEFKKKISWFGQKRPQMNCLIFKELENKHNALALKFLHELSDNKWSSYGNTFITDTNKLYEAAKDENWEQWKTIGKYTIIIGAVSGGVVGGVVAGSAVAAAAELTVAAAAGSTVAAAAGSTVAAAAGSTVAAAAGSTVAAAAGSTVAAAAGSTVAAAAGSTVAAAVGPTVVAATGSTVGVAEVAGIVAAIGATAAVEATAKVTAKKVKQYAGLVENQVSRNESYRQSSSNH